LLAQTGLGRLRAAAAPGPFLAGLLGAEAFGARGLAALGTQFTWAGDVQLFFMGTGSLALKAAGDTRLRPRGVALALGLALLVSLGVTFWLYLSIGYRHGWLGGYGWYFRSSPTYHWSWVASALAGQQPAELRVGQFLLLGAGLAAAVQAAYTARPGFPLHPAGLAIALTNTVWWDWASMFLAWLIKGLLLRAGGLRLYQRALPFFWGLILGSCAATGLTALLDMAR
jgi:hypothetical protein